LRKCAFPDDVDSRDTTYSLTASIISDAFVRGYKLSGVDNPHFHDLMHHDFSILLEQESPIQVIRTVSGHSNWYMPK
jgi:hypothetical protein